MKHFKLLVILGGFFSALIRFGIFILIGLILVVVGSSARAQTCVAVGGAFIAFALLASVIDVCRMVHAMNTSDHPALADIRKALESADSEAEMDKLMAEYGNDPGLIEARSARFYLQESLHEGCSFEEVIKAYESLGRNEETPPLEYSCITDEEGLMLFLTWSFDDRNGEFFQLRTCLSYDKPPKDINELKLLNDDKEKFFEAVRSSKGYKYSCENEGRDLKIFVESTG
ncbi:MAG: hypothetical protein K6F03_07950 [Saccharofermentans sp.]|nr:hypothetical protein [Saccharofermentans sp.]